MVWTGGPTEKKDGQTNSDVSKAIIYKAKTRFRKVQHYLPFAQNSFLNVNHRAM